jgi:succinate dehydrogenase / fumarate reductase flavoprotein subunit
MRHAFDTVKGSDYLADQDAVVKFTEDAPRRIYEMENWGTPFSRTPEGKIAQRPFGGAGFPRTCFAADRTGMYLIQTLWEQVCRYTEASAREEMVIYDEWIVLKIIVEKKKAVGVVAWNLAEGKLETFKADAIIMGTGGIGRIYANTSNALTNTGMGMALAYWAGVPLKDMEFIQFHPTTLKGNNCLMTEGCRGEGGYLINDKGERFLANYPDSSIAMEIAPRDIVSRNITKELIAGRGINGQDYVYLDLRHLGEEKIMTRLPGIRDLAMNFVGVDPIKEPVPIQPGQHYPMGGIDTDMHGATSIDGLYAAGECACVSVHGANRLGGNSLLETIIFGAAAGEAACEYIEDGGKTGDVSKTLEKGKKEVVDKIENLFNSKGNEDPSLIRDELQKTMAEKVGVFRNEKNLKAAHKKVLELRERYKKIKIMHKNDLKFNQDLMWNLELEGDLDIAETVVSGALNRKESRGSQSREDYTKRDDKNWLHHSLYTHTPKGAKIGKKKVTLGHFKPKARTY